jgi:hypothetical protein
VDDKQKDESSTSSEVTLEKPIITLKQAKDCLKKNCEEEQTACKFNDQCQLGISKFSKCYNITIQYEFCRDAQLDTWNDTRLISFELTDLMSCYDLCNWVDVGAPMLIVGLFMTSLLINL